MNKERLGGVADTHPLALRVDRDRFGHVEVGSFVDVDVAVAGEVLEHGHPGLGADALDEGLAAARDRHVDEVGHREKLTHGLAIADIDQLHAVGWETALSDGSSDVLDESSARVGRLLATAEDDRVA